MPASKETEQQKQKRREQQKGYRNQLVADRRSKGLCVQCGEDAQGKSRCQQCADKAKASRKRAQERRKAAGLCQNVGCKHEAMPGRTVCEACSKQASEASSRRYQQNKEKGVCRYCGADSGGKARCGDCAEAFDEYQQQFYQERRDAGLCVNCGKRKAVKERTLCRACQKHKNDVGKIRWARLKRECFEAYGGPECVGCGEKEIAVLELDHINGGGNKHRKTIGQSNTYLWLKQQGYPKGYRVLCPTCNKKAHAGIPLTPGDQ